MDAACGYTFTNRLRHDRTGETNSAISIGPVTRVSDIRNDAAALLRRRGWELLIPLGTLFMGGLITGGLLFHIDEYRFHAR